jgi:hypothetical protein
VENRISGLKDKIDIKEKQKISFTKDSRAAKVIHKNSATPSNNKPVNHWHQRRTGVSQRDT